MFQLEDMIWKFRNNETHKIAQLGETETCKHFNYVSKIGSAYTYNYIHTWKSCSKSKNLIVDKDENQVKKPMSNYTSYIVSEDWVEKRERIDRRSIIEMSVR